MKIAVVIPSYKVTEKISDVLGSIGPNIHTIYVVDDCCPDKSGDFVKKNIKDDRIRVLFNEKNLGVGGAVVTGYKAAIKDKMDVVVKIDGDNQMNPELIPFFIDPIISSNCDYTKGNRFFNVSDVKQMPIIRIFGNAVLSFVTKASSGYWHIFDPTNGYTAISVECLKNLDLDKISKRYFFESDMLFRLNIIKANVKDIPMRAKYDGEVSNLKISRILFNFTIGHIRNFNKRIFYDYFLRDFSLASVSLLFGIILSSFGFLFGSYHWIKSINEHVLTSSGTVMLSALPLIIGTQLILNFINYDISKSKITSGATYGIKK